MFYVYVLRSTTDEKLYIGSTNDLRRRLMEHSSGLVPSTRPRLPLTLVYYEAYRAEADARLRESMLKRFSGATVHLKKRIQNSLVFSKAGQTLTWKSLRRRREARASDFQVRGKWRNW